MVGIVQGQDQVLRKGGNLVVLKTIKGIFGTNCCILVRQFSIFLLNDDYANEGWTYQRGTNAVGSTMAVSLECV